MALKGKMAYRRIPVLHHLPPWSVTLIAACALIAAGIGQALVQGQTTTEVKQAVTVRSVQFLRDIPNKFPFDDTSDLFVLDHGSKNVLRITPFGVVTIEVTEAEILAATAAADVSFRDRGIAFDVFGSMYFTEGFSDSILKKPRGGALFLLVSEAAIIAAAGGTGNPKAIAYGRDGFLYVNDESSDSVLQVDPISGAIRIYVSKARFQALLEALPGIVAVDVSVDLDGGIVRDNQGIVYTTSAGTPNALFAIALGGIPSVLTTGDPLDPFKDIDVFFTRAASGDLFIAENNGVETIFRVTPGGVVSTFLSRSQLEAVFGGLPVDLEGGFAFDSSGNLYVAEQNEDHILKFDPRLQGSIWVSRDAMEAITGVRPDLEGGIAFAPSVEFSRGLVFNQETTFLVPVSLAQGDAGRIQIALENHSNQRAVAIVHFPDLPVGVAVTLSSLRPNEVISAVPASPTTFLVGLEASVHPANPNLELLILAGDTTPPGHYRFLVLIKQIPG